MIQDMLQSPYSAAYWGAAIGLLLSGAALLVPVPFFTGCIMCVAGVCWTVYKNMDGPDV